MFIGSTMEGNSRLHTCALRGRMCTKRAQHREVAVKNMLVSSAAGHRESNAEHTGKADNRTYKQSACQAVAKEVKSHFPWIPPNEYA